MDPMLRATTELPPKLSGLGFCSVVFCRGHQDMRGAEGEHPHVLIAHVQEVSTYNLGVGTSQGVAAHNDAVLETLWALVL
mmetsp:Transcript_15516/g.36353  ORF Transcript_15516/g.36353 Transcript_15516/m.36353 type:complete len:80 (-) Transcript_15516:1419-1658(-)